MSFTSVQFLIFFPIVILGLLIVPKVGRTCWLLFASYYFYMCWNSKYALLLIFSTLITYITGRKLENSVSQKKKKQIVVLCCIVNFLILFVFKYFNFVLDSLDLILIKVGMGGIQSRVDLLLPVGISFYTFQAIGYIVDVYRGNKAEHNFVKYALFVSFFPQLGSGPIERSQNIFPQLEALKTRNLWDYDRIKNGLLLMLWGMFQKIVIADRVALYVDTVYNNYENYGLFTILVAMILYSFQIYCDFDGYSNMARGIAQVIGIDIMKNFRCPYFALNIQDFWRRWHISLTSWFRDYLYIPLGGNRKGQWRKQINTLVVFSISGLWHGASWNYIIWGLLHGLMQVICNLFSKLNKREASNFIVKLINRSCTFGIVTIAWLFFRMPTMQQLIAVIKQMNRVGEFNEVFQVIGVGDRNLLIVGLIILFVVDILHERGVEIRKWVSRQNICLRYILYIGVIVSCIYLGVQTSVVGAAQQFIYFQF